MNKTKLTSTVKFVALAAAFGAIMPMLASAPTSAVLAATELSAQIEAARGFADVVSGALIIPISRNPRDYLILWRKPLARTITWAGNPAKAAERLRALSADGADDWRIMAALSEAEAALDRHAIGGGVTALGKQADHDVRLG